MDKNELRSYLQYRLNLIIEAKKQSKAYLTEQLLDDIQNDIIKKDSEFLSGMKDLKIRIECLTPKFIDIMIDTLLEVINYYK